MNSARYHLSRNLIVVILCCLMSSVHAAMLADFNNPDTWAAGWNFVGKVASRDTAKPYEGTGDLKVSFGATNDWNIILFSLPAEQDWSGRSTLQVAAKYGVANTTGQVYFSYLAKNTEGNYAWLATDFLRPTDAWLRSDLLLGAPLRTAVRAIQFSWYGPENWSSASEFYFDAIDVPEPAMAAMLGLGSLAFLRRRR